MSLPIKFPPPLYTVAHYPHGFAITPGDPQASGISASLFGHAIQRETAADSKHARSYVIHPGIAHHLKESGQCRPIVVCGLPDQLELWRDEIEESLKHLDPRLRWWLGTDVGLSSACIFSVLCEDMVYSAKAEAVGGSATPRDSSDLGRCLRLLKLIPKWRDRLDDVARRWPDGKWPAVIARWPELESATPDRQTAILREIHSTPA